jgi:hypothetical protein
MRGREWRSALHASRGLPTFTVSSTPKTRAGSFWLGGACYEVQGEALSVAQVRGRVPVLCTLVCFGEWAASTVELDVALLVVVVASGRTFWSQNGRTRAEMGHLL